MTPKVTATITTPPPPPQKDRRIVTLTMPYDVAVTLRELLGNVSGCPDTTYRVHTAAVSDALDVNGVLWRPYLRFSGSVNAAFFNNDTE